jgi:hypothetical protein
MAINLNGTNIENVLFDGQQLDKVTFDGVVVWENWKEKTGDLNTTTSNQSNGGWNTSSWTDLGKEIIPLEGDIYFKWSMSNGQYSTSCSASIKGKTTDGTEITLFSHSCDSFGKNSSGSSTEEKSVREESQIPIRYIASYCGGGNGGGSTSYQAYGSITKWKEKGV